MAVGQYAVRSDTGKKRRRNEDNYVVAPPLFAVADGMGGAQAGEVASKLAAATVESGNGSELNGVERVRGLIAEANRRVFDRASSDPAASGMGTTMTVALVEGMTVTIGHVGDSRAYLLREGQMQQLTDDHSLVNELLKSGKLTAEEAQTHPQRSVITRAVGTDPEVDADVFPIEARQDDVFLLCSDGLTDMVEDEDILEVLDKHRDDLDRAVRRLVETANRRGGEDNITAVVFRVVPDGEADAEQTMRLPVQREPDEETLESVEDVAGGDTLVIAPERIEAELAQDAAAPREPLDTTARIRLALTLVVLIAAAAVLLTWGLLR